MNKNTTELSGEKPRPRRPHWITKPDFYIHQLPEGRKALWTYCAKLAARQGAARGAKLIDFVIDAVDLECRRVLREAAARGENVPQVMWERTDGGGQRTEG